MWTVQTENLAQGRGIRHAIDRDGLPATYIDVLRAWQSDADFRGLWNAVLAKAPFSAYRWETPPVSTRNIEQAFEFVLLDSPGLSRAPEPQAFAKYFRQAKSIVSVFTNLGGDATLIVPCPVANESAYGHLAAFVRLAPENQRHALWQIVGDTMMQRVGTEPVWLNTAGAGVSWLHVRLDDRPKYYGFGPYKESA